MNRGSSEGRSSSEDLEALLKAANRAEKAAAHAVAKAEESKLALIECIMAHVTQEKLDRLFRLGPQLEPDQVLYWAAGEAASTSLVQRARWWPF